MASNTASVSSPCRWYNYGYCWRGSSCPNSHSTPLQNSDGDDLSFTVHPGSTSAAGAVTLNFGAPPPPSPSPAPLASATASTSAAISNPIPTAPNDQEEDDEEEICAICYEPQVEWGLLDNCSHTFCMPCIRSWTTPRGDQTHAQAEAGKTCPACRRKCQVVVPSTAFLREGEERRRRIREFKDSQAQIPCEDFEASPRTKKYCPRGRDCLYSHTLPTGEHFTFTHTYHDTLLAHQRQLDALAARSLFLQIIQGDFLQRGEGRGRGDVMQRMMASLEGEREDVVRLVGEMLAVAFGGAAEESGREGNGVDWGSEDDEEDDEWDDEDEHEHGGVGEPDGDSEYDFEDDDDDLEEEDDDAWESTDSAASNPPHNRAPRPPPPAASTNSNVNPMRRPIHPRLAAARAHQPAPLPTPPAQRERMLRDDELEDDDLPELEGIDSDSDAAPRPTASSSNPRPRPPADSDDSDDPDDSDDGRPNPWRDGRVQPLTEEERRIRTNVIEGLLRRPAEPVVQRGEHEESDSESEEEDAMPALEGISSSEDNDSDASPSRRPSARPLPRRPSHTYSSSEDDSSEDEERGPNVFVDHHRPMTAEEDALRREVLGQMERAFGAIGVGPLGGRGGSESESEEEEEHERRHFGFEDEDEERRERLRMEALERRLREFDAWGESEESEEESKGEMPALEGVESDSSAEDGSNEDEDSSADEASEDEMPSLEDVDSPSDDEHAPPTLVGPPDSLVTALDGLLASTARRSPPPAATSSSPPPLQSTPSDSPIPSTSSAPEPAPPADSVSSALDERRRMAEQRAQAADERARREAEDKWAELD